MKRLLCLLKAFGAEKTIFMGLTLGQKKTNCEWESFSMKRQSGESNGYTRMKLFIGGRQESRQDSRLGREGENSFRMASQ